jgi:hypothetical protein
MFKYIDKPQLPWHLVDYVHKRVEEYNVESKLPEFQKMQINDDIIAEIEKHYGTPKEGLGVTFDTAYKYKGLCNFTMIRAEGELLQWITEHVAPGHCGVHIQVIDQGEYVFPHIDMLRNRVWNYTLDTGDAETSFYKAKPEFEDLPLVPRTYVPYERVDKIETIKIDANRWHELDVSKIHGVEKVKTPRIAISVSFVD